MSTTVGRLMATPQWLFPFPPCKITVSIKQPFVSEPPEQLMLFDAIETTYRPGASWNVAEAPLDTLKWMPGWRMERGLQAMQRRFLCAR
nr:hypothetical protein [Burkholderia pseudomallei]